jgi:hypothetical protein
MAVVIMEFPAFVLVDCVMMLEICESEVECLVKDLFGITVQSVGGVRYLLFGNSVRLISNTSKPETILKGVSDEAIIQVFGLEIYRAIKVSTMYMRELQEHGSLVT